MYLYIYFVVGYDGRKIFVDNLSIVVILLGIFFFYGVFWFISFIYELKVRRFWIKKFCEGWGFG